MMGRLATRERAFRAALGVCLLVVLGSLGARLDPEMVLLGVGVLLAPSSSVYARSVGRYLLRPVLHGVRLDFASHRAHAHAV